MRKWSKGSNDSGPHSRNRIASHGDSIIRRIGNVRTRLFILKLNYNEEYDTDPNLRNSECVLLWRKTGAQHYSHAAFSRSHTRSLTLSSVIGVHCTTSSSASWLRGLDGDYFVASIFSKKATAPLRLLFPASRRTEFEVTMRVLIYGIHAANTSDRSKIGKIFFKGWHPNCKLCM